MAVKIFKLGSHNIKSLNDCSDVGSIDEKTSSTYKFGCDPNSKEPCEDKNTKNPRGFSANCDPLQAGKIYNDNNPNPNVIYNYAKGIRGTDDAVLALFKDIVVIDDDGKIWPVPIIWGTQERAVAYIIQKNAREDETLVVDRPTLPMLAIHQSNIAPNKERYVYHKAINYFRDKNGKPGMMYKEKKDNDTVFGFSKGIPVDISYNLYAWTRYLEDMNEILEQILPKFSLLAYIKVKGIPWEIPVKLEAIGNNINHEVGDKEIRVIKYQFNLVAETYIPQPITRKKVVQKIVTDFHNSTNEKEISKVYGRMEVEQE